MRMAKAGYRAVGRALVATVALVFTAPVVADNWLAVTSEGVLEVQQASTALDPDVAVQHFDDMGVKVRVDVAGLNLSVASTDKGEFVHLSLPEDSYAGTYGEPALPVIRRLFVAPEGAEVRLQVREGRSSTVDLKRLGFNQKVMPLQPPVLQSPQSLRAYRFNHKPAAYAKRTSCLNTRATVEKLGVMRGHQLYLLEMRPVDYKPASDRLSIWPTMEAEISFVGGTGQFSAMDAPALKGQLLNPPPVTSLRAGSGGNYLIVANSTFMTSTAMTQFVDFKTSQGFTVLTYTVPAGVTKETIKSYISSLWGGADAPDFVLLVGDVDTMPYWTGGGAHNTVTDLPYACMDAGDDWYPDMGIGRWSVQTVSHLEDVVEKTIRIESGNFPTPMFPRRGIFLSGMNSLSGDEDSHNYVIDTYLEPLGFTSFKVFERSLGGTTQDVYDAFNSGGGLYSCIYGHASPGTTGNYFFANGPDWTHDDIYATNAGAITGFLVQITCNTGEFHNWDECFSEAWLRAPDRGAVCNQAASWWVYSGSHGASPGWPRTAALYKGTFDSIYDDGIREASLAWQSSIVKLIATYGASNVVCRDYSEMYNLMGDPSFYMSEPSDNYLIIVPPDFVDSAPLLEFIAAKEANGFNVIQYHPASGTSNTDIQTYIAGLWGTPDQPRYVLIIGDTSGTTSTAATIPHFVGQGYRSACTDWPYVCFDAGDDYYPEIPIGRFSVVDVAQLQVVVDKTLFVEAGNFSDPDYVKRATFLANPGTQGTAEPSHNYVIDTYITPNDYEGLKLYAVDGADTADVAAAVNAGSLWTLYYGHSGSSGWWDPGFGTSDVQALTNDGLYGMAFGWSCNTNNYATTECFGEAWLRQPNGGSVIYCSASDYIYWGSVEDWEPAVVHERSVFASFFEDDIWVVGDAWLNGLYRFLTDYGQWDGNQSSPPSFDEQRTRDFMEEFPILGDPSLELPQPNGFKLEVTPTAYDICSPPTVEVAYTIEVGQLGSFAETVTLSSTGAPTGSTVSFSVNNMSPPFTTIMTVSDLDTVTPGQSTIQIDGVSATKSRSTDVDLAVSAGAPSLVTLTAPSDGAVDVNRMPTLTWSAASQATWYDVEVATDASFNNIVYSTTTSNTSVSLSTMLASLTTHYWHVRAGNQCGDSGFTSAFTFTTIEVPDYFTEEFTTFDLEYKTITFTPDGSGSFYSMCIEDATALPYDTSTATFVGGNGSGMSEDGYFEAVLTGETVSLYGTTYDRFYIGDGGYITFTGGDGDYSPSLAEHFEMPRFSMLYHDLSVTRSTEGQVTWEQLADRAIVTYENIRDYYDNYPSNTFQVELHFDGTIRITYLQVDVDPCIVGLSQGLDTPEDYVEMDLSAAPGCGPNFTMAVAPVSQDICVPANADYTVTLESVQGFSEAVTLTASNVPTGATVGFTTNPVTPSGTAVMTISDTASVAPGDYTIMVTGTATGGLIRNQNVQLSVAAGTPGGVSLISPTNGATDVSRTPILTWSAATNATEYYLEVASDAGFATVVYSNTVADVTDTVGTSLVSDTEYFWRVQASNNCGTSAFSSTFSFTTLSQRDYFTEDFDDDFDLTNTSVVFTPDGLGDYDACVETVTGFNTAMEPDGNTVDGDNLASGSHDDGYWAITPSTSVSLYGVDYTTVYINTNGSVTFTEGDSSYSGGLSLHFDKPRISGFLRDLNPSCAGTVWWKETADRLAVTFDGIEEYSSSCSSDNTVSYQIEMFFDGEIRVTWLSNTITAGGVAGLSETTSEPADYTESDLSANVACGAPPTGACCVNEVCSIQAEVACGSNGGTYQGDDTTCTPDPCYVEPTGACCINDTCSELTESACGSAGGGYFGDDTTCTAGLCDAQDSSCLIISEVVHGQASGGCPRFVEITNTGTSDYMFTEGGIIAQTDGASDLTVDISLVGQTIAAGQSFIVNATNYGSCSGAFDIFYGFDPDFETTHSLGNGNDVIIITDETDGSNLVDIYGEFGVDGTGTPWEYHYGYAYRLSPYIMGDGGTFMIDEWFIGGEGSLDGADPTSLLLTLTSPATHDYDGTCTGDVLGACCIESDCSMLTAAACAVAGGVYHGDGVNCHPNPCAGPVTGACCINEVCSILTELACGTAGGTYQGDGTDCDPDPCYVPPTGACCTGGVCSIATEADCLAGGGTYQGDDTDCDPDPCYVPPTGACCTDEVCSIATEADCLAGGGTYQGDDTDCDPDPCYVPPTGACCTDEVCSIATEADCLAGGGTYQGDDTDCDPDPCSATPTGACCINEACSILTEVACGSAGGTYQGDATDCDPNPCIPVGACCVGGSCTGVMEELDCVGVWYEGLDCGTADCYLALLDYCETAQPIADGATAFDTTGATTDGPEHASCEFDGQTYHDIWYEYTPGASGELEVSTCDNAAYDTDLVVYHGCDCPVTDARMLACNDDTTGCSGYTSVVSVAVTAGDCYKVRIGGYNNGDMGTGTVTITLSALGACCTDEVCSIATEAVCVDGGGTYQGDDTTCDPDPCYVAPTGACCTAEVCSIATEAVCIGGGGTYQGDDTTCDPDPCYVPPTGACCTAEVCSIATEAVCVGGGGTYQGDDTTCDPDPCYVPPTGACCTDEICSISTEAVCVGGGGMYQGDDTTCDPDPCYVPPTGACCTDEVCSISTEAVCVGGGGTYQGDDTTCDPDPCYVAPTGACCVAGVCGVGTEAACTAAGGSYQGDYTDCDPDPCYVATGACCVGAMCSVVSESSCDAFDGIYHGDDTVCDPNPCTSLTPCVTDLDCVMDHGNACDWCCCGTYEPGYCDPPLPRMYGDISGSELISPPNGTVNLTDVMCTLDAFGPGGLQYCPNADIVTQSVDDCPDGNGLVNLSDILKVLDAFGAPTNPEAEMLCTCPMNP